MYFSLSLLLTTVPIPEHNTYDTGQTLKCREKKKKPAGKGPWDPSNKTMTPLGSPLPPPAHTLKKLATQKFQRTEIKQQSLLSLDKGSREGAKHHSYLHNQMQSLAFSNCGKNSKYPSWLLSETLHWGVRALLHQHCPPLLSAEVILGHQWDAPTQQSQRILCAATNSLHCWAEMRSLTPSSRLHGHPCINGIHLYK